MSDNKTVIEIVKLYLDQNGYDGLFSPGCECACLNDDLAPCGEIQEDCTVGYKVVLNHSDPDCDDPDWNVQAKKPFDV